MTELSTREQGVLEAFLVGRGDLVESGQVVARLESSVEHAAVKLAKARTELDAVLEEQVVAVNFAKRALERSKELYEKKAISYHDKDDAETTYAREQLRLRQAEQRQRLALLEHEGAQRVLEKPSVRSPLRGVVVERLIDVGESVQNRAIVKLAQIDPLRVEVIVPVEHYGVISAGDEAEVTPKYPGASVHRAVVDVVDRVVDAASNTFGVRLTLPNPDYGILGGVRCDVRFLSR